MDKKFHSPCQQMSASLKARLKRSSIYSMSPLTTKKQCARVHSFSTPTKADVSERSDCDVLQEPQQSESQAHIQARKRFKSNNNCKDNVVPISDVLSDVKKYTPKKYPKNLSTFSSPALKVQTCKSPLVSSQSTRADILITEKDDQKFGINKKQQLKRQLLEKEETLRKLKMVKMYRTKNNLDELEILIEKWRRVCQEGLTHLMDTAPAEPKPTLGQLIEHLQIDPALVKYREEDDCFVSE